jgi:folate-dependent phosphoribosylglycinamide formyltransferase PurN
MTSLFLCTSTGPRHAWLARQLAAKHTVIGTACEDKGSDRDVAQPAMSALVRDHHQAFASAELQACGRAVWPAVPRFALPRGAMNRWDEPLQAGIDAADVVVLFGCSVIDAAMLSGRVVVNLHMGLSPHYRGAATNVWPLVDGRPECIGATLHHVDALVDHGPILAQVRPDLSEVTSVHDVGLRALFAGTAMLTSVLSQPLPPGSRQGAPRGPAKRRADFTDATVVELSKWRTVLDDYLSDRPKRDAAVPLIPAGPPEAPSSR